MRFWWITEFIFKLEDKKYIKVEITYFIFITILTIILWPSKSLDLNKYSIPDLFMIFSLTHFLFITYLSSLISSGNLLSDREFRIISLVKYSEFSILNIIIGRILSTFFYLLYIFLILLPFNIMINFIEGIGKIFILYGFILLDSIPIVGLGILWSTFLSPSVNWFLHWVTYLFFILFPFLFPSTFFIFPLNQILWLVKAENILYLKVNFNPKEHLLLIISFYLLIFLLSILIAQKRLKYYKGEDKK